MNWRVILLWLLVANATTANVRGNTTSSTRHFQLDAANRVICTTTPLGRSNLMVFNHQGLPILLIDPAGQQTTNTFDARGRLVTRGDKVGVTTYTYDPNNNPTAASENVGTNSWTYDAYNRVSSYRDVYGNLIQYRYDANGNCTNLIYPGGRTVAYAYDSLNRVTNITDWAGRQTSLAYDLDGHLTSITRPNGTYRTVSYDAAGQVTNILEQMANNLPIAWFRLSWTNSGNMAWEFAAPLPHTNSPPTRTMTYDNDNRLASFQGPGMTGYQNAGVDLDGNLINGPILTTNFSAYVYDARNRLLSAGGTTNAYDAINNRIGQVSGTNATVYVVNPNTKLPQVLMRIKNGVTNYYIYGAGLLYQITETSAGTNTLTYHYDYRGSTIAVSGDNGLVTDRVEYSLYGSTTYRIGISDTPFLFNGRYGVQTDPNGLLYMQARYYNPYLCRFINPDPSGFKGGLNFYAYAAGNPVSHLDPFGLNAAATGDSDNSWYYNQLMNQGPAIEPEDTFDKVADVAGSIIDTPNQIAQATGIPPMAAAGLMMLLFPPEGAALAESTETTVAGETVAANNILSPSVTSSFANGQYQPWIATESTILYRAESEGQGLGSFFGTEAPANSLDAEMMFNINKWGNNATELSTYQVPTGTTGFIGPVAGGSGVQIFIPGATTMPGIQLIDQTSLFSTESKYISSPLK